MREALREVLFHASPPILSSSHTCELISGLQRPFFQISSHPQVLGVITWLIFVGTIVHLARGSEELDQGHTVSAWCTQGLEPHLSYPK